MISNYLLIVKLNIINLIFIALPIMHIMLNIAHL